MIGKVLILGDIHTRENAFEELKAILTEVFYNQKENISAVWLLGDVFDRKHPSNKEIDFVTEHLYAMSQHCPVTIVTGNHDDVTALDSALNYTRHFGIKLIRHHGTISLNDKTIYLGHHFVDKSDEFLKNDKYKVADLAKFDFALLGHDHRFLCYKENVINMGSVRRINFGEVNYHPCTYALLYPETLAIEFFTVESIIPMVEVKSLKEALKYDSQVKIRLIIESFEEYLRVLPKLPDLEQKFYIFKVKHDYSQQVTKKDLKRVQRKGKSFEEIFKKFLMEKVENKEVRTFIEESV